MVLTSSCRPSGATVTPTRTPPRHFDFGSVGDKENVTPKLARTPTLVKGQPLPPLKHQITAALNGFKPTDMSKSKVIYTGEDLPASLQALGSPNWKDPKCLKKVFYRRQDRKLKDSREIPGALLFAAHDLTDRLILVNWWLQLSKDARKEVDATLWCLFPRHMISASPLKMAKSVVDAVVRQKLSK